MPFFIYSKYNTTIVHDIFKSVSNENFSRNFQTVPKIYDNGPVSSWLYLLWTLEIFLTQRP